MIKETRKQGYADGVQRMMGCLTDQPTLKYLIGMQSAIRAHMIDVAARIYELDVPVYLVTYYNCENLRCTIEVPASNEDEAKNKITELVDETITLIDVELTEKE